MLKDTYSNLGLSKLVADLSPISRNSIICNALKFLGDEVLKNAITGIEKVKSFIVTLMG